MDWISWCVVLTLSLTTKAFECPKGAGCNTCRRNPEGKYQIDCFTSNNSDFAVSIRPDDYLRLTCPDSANWTEFKLGATSPLEGVKTLDFTWCDLPRGKDLGDIARQLLTDDVEKFYFRSYKNLSSTLTKKYLRGFDHLRELTLSNNGLSQLPEDFLDGFENLTFLNLRENDLRRIPDKFFSVANLEVVELSFNKIESFASTTFDKLRRVNLLNIRNNGLVKILPYTFDNLISLEILDMQRNYLQSLPADIFANLTNLRVINLSQNNFTANSLPDKLFRNNGNLRKVGLYENKRNITTLPNGFFANLTMLEAVKLYKCGFTSLPEDLFRGAINLRNVSLGNNRLSTIPSKIFYDNYELYILDLSFNELSYLPDDVFSSLGKLIRLDLTKNHLKTISNKLFSGLLSLRKLNMELINIENIDTDSFNFIKNLTIADFSHNSLTLRSPLADGPYVFMEYRNLSSLLTKDSMRGFTRIKELTLSNNDFSELPERFLDALEDLTFLNLEKNNLHHLPEKFFSAVNLETIQLGFNKFESFASTTFDKLQRVKLLNISNNDLVTILPHTFDNLVSLKTLDMHKNKLRTLPSDRFTRLVNLDIINLSQNGFDADSLPVDLFRNNLNLETVILSENKGEMKTLPAGFFANLTKLRAVELYKNNFVSLPEDLFWGATSLKNISLQKNSLETLPNSIFNHNYELSTLDLSFNKLTVLHDDVFVNLRRLVQLDLSNNRLTTISEKLFSNLWWLEELNMEGNNVKNVHRNALNVLKSLSTVKFSYAAFEVPKIYYALSADDESTELTIRGRPILLPKPIFDITEIQGFQTPPRNEHPSFFSGDGAVELDEDYEDVLFSGESSHIQELSLRNGGYTTISEHYLEKYPELIHLDLEGNELSVLPEEFFSISTLEVVKLGMNKIRGFVPTAFNKLNRVNSLNISHNEITKIERHTFDSLVSLKELFIHGNKFNENALPADLFVNNGNLENVDLYMNRGNMTTLPNGFFANLPKLNSVKLHRNDLKELPEDLFWNTINLTRIDLSKNKLHSLPSRIFTDTYSLDTLDLSFNTLSYLPDDVFSSLMNLTNLDLSTNRLTTISHKLLRNLKQLKDLNMKYNAITNLHIEAFYFLPIGINDIDLEEMDYNFFMIVDLRHNNISRVHLPTRLIEERHVTIKIENNPIRCDCHIYDLLRFRERRFDPIVESVLTLRTTYLKCKEPPNNRGFSVADLNSKTLKCDFDESEFEHAHCPQMCKCHRRPENRAFLVNCAYKGLTEAPPKLKCPADHRMELNLTGNLLTTMPIFEQPEYDKITTLTLDHNRISSLTVDKVPKNLEILQLNHNNLARINRATIDSLNSSSSLNKLTLQANPWFCDCDAHDFLTFVQWKRQNIPDLSKVTCVDKNKSIMDMDSRDFCPEEFGLIIGSCLLIAFLGIIVGTLAALYYRYQREIKVWLYARQWCLWLVTEDELDKDKLYDAFISFSHKDEQFVVNDLVPKLEEGPKPFKLCLHYRDWLAGEWIPKQIARSVEQSRRTIVVLSPNFLESVWGRMEFRAAHSQALSEGRARVIVILYGNIGPTDDLDPELKAYLSMNTYVKWGDPWFWEKLKYALPHPPDPGTRRTGTTVFETAQPLMRVENGKSEFTNTRTIPTTTASVDSVTVSINNDATDNGSEKLQVQGMNLLNAGPLPNVITNCDSNINKSEANEIVQEECTTAL